MAPWTSSPWPPGRRRLTRSSRSRADASLSKPARDFRINSFNATDPPSSSSLASRLSELAAITGWVDLVSVHLFICRDSSRDGRELLYHFPKWFSSEASLEGESRTPGPMLARSARLVDITFVRANTSQSSPQQCRQKQRVRQFFALLGFTCGGLGRVDFHNPITTAEGVLQSRYALPWRFPWLGRQRPRTPSPQASATPTTQTSPARAQCIGSSDSRRCTMGDVVVGHLLQAESLICRKNKNLPQDANRALASGMQWYGKNGSAAGL